MKNSIYLFAVFLSLSLIAPEKQREYTFVSSDTIYDLPANKSICLVHRTCTLSEKSLIQYQIDTYAPVSYKINQTTEGLNLTIINNNINSIVVRCLEKDADVSDSYWILPGDSLTVRSENILKESGKGIIVIMIYY